MALKMQVSSIEEVDEKFRDQYKEVPQGDTKVYRLDVDGVEDVSALKSAHEHVKKERDEAVAAAKAKGEDWKNIQADYEKRLKESADKVTDAVKTAQKALKTEKRSKVIDDIAAKVAVDVDSQDVVRLFAKDRIRIDIEDDRAIPRVLDVEGKVSSLSVDDLVKELKADKRLARVAGASRGSGGGARPESLTRVGDQSSNGKPPTNPKELAAWIKSKAASRGA